MTVAFVCGTILTALIMVIFLSKPVRAFITAMIVSAFGNFAAEYLTRADSIPEEAFKLISSFETTSSAFLMGAAVGAVVGIAIIYLTSNRF